MAEYNDIHPPTCSRCHAPVPEMTVTPVYLGKGITVAVRCHGESQDALLTWQEMIDADGPTLRALLADRLTMLAVPVPLPVSSPTPSQLAPPPTAYWGGGQGIGEEWLPIDDVVVTAAQQMGWHYTPSTWVPSVGPAPQPSSPTATHTLTTGSGPIQSPVLPAPKEP